jgi:peptidoglycan/xylan/chitin deacetylase (PgdA/CDA1 family)
MIRSFVGLLLLATVAAGHATAAEPFDIVITVDDLPAHGPLPPGMTRLGIAEAHICTLQAHKVREAYGFVNAAKLKDDPDAQAVLRAWRAAGYPLGNHTFSHMNLSRAATLAAWEADVEAGEPALATLMQGADWHYLRLPNLSDGTDKERHDGAFGYLGNHGYRIADVSVAFSDWVYTDAYARCVAKGDTASIEALKAQYLKGVDDGIAHMKAVSNRVYGRMIPQVLLTHIGGWSAVTLPEVLDRLDAAGARYVTLAQAQADPAYAQPGGGSVMTRTAKRDGISLSDIPAPTSPLDAKSVCR